jgi:hypothetical protein
METNADGILKRVLGKRLHPIPLILMFMRYGLYIMMLAALYVV